MFGRRFPFLPSNWCRGNFGFLKGEGEEKSGGGKSEEEEEEKQAHRTAELH